MNLWTQSNTFLRCLLTMCHVLFFPSQSCSWKKEPEVFDLLSCQKEQHDKTNSTNKGFKQLKIWQVDKLWLLRGTGPYNSHQSAAKNYLLFNDPTVMHTNMGHKLGWTIYTVCYFSIPPFNSKCFTDMHVSDCTSINYILLLTETYKWMTKLFQILFKWGRDHS